MEWMLQVVDELDDAVGALRQLAMGVGTEMPVLLAGSVGVFGIGAALVLGAQSLLIFAEAILLGSAAALKIRGTHPLAAR
jgi:hypothetical protein